MAEPFARDLPSGEVTFLFTDIEGSTRLLHRLGDEYPPMLARHHELLRGAVAEHGGHVVSTSGDSFFVAFENAHDALDASAAIQQRLADTAWPMAGPLLVRMGIHTGDAHVVDGDYVSLTVNQAARIEAVAHGGQVLVSAATVGALGAGAPRNLVDLGEFRLKDFDAPQRLFQLQLDAGPRTFPAVRAPSANAGNMPRHRSSFVGRVDELAALTKLLREASLLTIVGTGGVGKTRLACELIAEERTQFPDGAWFVELASVRDPAAVDAAVGRSVGAVAKAGQEAFDAACERMAEKRAVIVLDNCEHLVDRCAELADGLIERCPDVTVLATSRVALRVADEQVYRIPPLGVAPVGAADVQAVLNADATQLFAARAARANAEFHVNADNAPVVAEICQRLDGIPLAIELAAARLRDLSPEELRRGLDDRFALLTEGLRTTAPRQQTLEATLLWSYDLLDEAHRRLVNQLGVFAPGFGADDVRAVADSAGLDVEAAIRHLTEMSMVVESPEGDRFSLLESVRAFAVDRLRDSGELAATADRHLAHYVTLSDAAVNDADALAAIDANARVAIQWCASGDGDLESGLRLAAVVAWRWQRAGEFAEGRGILSALVDKSTGPSIGRSRARRELAMSCFNLGDFAAAEAFAAGALDDAITCGVARDERAALLTLGRVETRLGRLDEAAKHLEAGLELASAEGDRLAVAQFQSSLSAVVYEHDYAIELLKGALANFEEVGERRAVASALYDIASHALRLGDLDEGARRLEESLALMKEFGDVRAVARVEHAIGTIAYAQERFDVAEKAFTECLASFRSLQDRWGETDAIGALAAVAEARGNAAAAVQLYEEAIDIAREVGETSSLYEHHKNLAEALFELCDFDRARTVLDEAARLAALLADPDRMLDNAAARLRCRVLAGDADSLAALLDELDHDSALAALPGMERYLRIFRPRRHLLRREWAAAEPLLRAAIAEDDDVESLADLAFAEALLGRPSARETALAAARRASADSVWFSFRCAVLAVAVVSASTGDYPRALRLARAVELGEIRPASQGRYQREVLDELLTTCTAALDADAQAEAIAWARAITPDAVLAALE
ncbi:MAG: hypothetical protein QOK28_3222 [Actinomycetota bacterium]